MDRQIYSATRRLLETDNFQIHYRDQRPRKFLDILSELPNKNISYHNTSKIFCVNITNIMTETYNIIRQH